MKLTLSSAVFISLMSSAAMAFDVTGGSVVLNHNIVEYTTGYIDHQDHTQGTVAFSLGNGFGAQAGLSIGADSNERDYLNGDVHLTYAVSPEVTLGAFFGEETLKWEDNSVSKYGFFGVEAAYTKNAFSMQTALASEYTIELDHYSHKAIAIDAVYGLTKKVTLTGGLHVFTYKAYDYEETYHYMYVGAGYAVVPNMDVNVTYGRMNMVNGYTTRQLSLILTYNFSKPALFQQRDTYTLLPGI